MDNYGYKEGKGFRFRFLIGALLVLVIIAMIAAVFLINSGIKSNNYKKALAAGNEYFNAGDYRNAIIEYKKAIITDGDEEGAYMNIMSAYIALDDYASAKDILEYAVNKINSPMLEDKRAELETLTGDHASEAVAAGGFADSGTEGSKGVAIDNLWFDKIAKYTYNDYYREFGDAVSNSSNDNKIELYYTSAGVKTVYYDMDNEKVLNLEGNMPIAATKACCVHLDNLSRIFKYEKEWFTISKAKLGELFDSKCNFFQNEDDGKYYMSVDYRGCKLTIETDGNGNIVSDSADNSIVPLNRAVEEVEEGKGRVEGYIQDAMTGKGMNATIIIRESDNGSGDELGRVESDSDGLYTYEGPSGTYTVEIDAEGYVSEYIDIEIADGESVVLDNVVLSPEVGYGEMRIVLTWGAAPADLDSHVEGTSSAGSLFNINFVNKDAGIVGNLDVDAVSGYGPETVTISDTGSSFEYYVEDFRRTGGICDSGAVVKVYLNGQASPYTFNVPAGAGSNRWNVFSYANGVITPVETVE